MGGRNSIANLSVPEFERLSRVAGGLDVDKHGLKRYSDFVNRKASDLLVRGQAAAKANGRDIIEPHDSQIAKGLQESVQAFKKIDMEVELNPDLDEITKRPPLEVAHRAETEAELALPRVFTIIDPNRQNPQTWQGERAFSVLDLLL